MKERRELLMVSKTVMVAISKKAEESPRPLSALNPGEKHAVKRGKSKEGREELLSNQGRDEAYRRPGRHDCHDGQDHKHAAPQVANIKKKKKLN